MIQPLAYIHPQAKIAENVVIDPFVTIHKDVVIGEGTWIGSNVTIMEGARIGKNCKIFPGAVISAVPQDLKYNGEETKLIIGILIYFLSYQTLIQIENLAWFIIVFLLNFIAIIIRRSPKNEYIGISF